MPDLPTFYGILRDAVKFYPHVEKWRRPQTFGVIDSFAQLTNDNLGKTIADKGKNYFFSRRWAAQNYNPSKVSYDFPGLFVIELGAGVEEPFAREPKSVDTFQLLFASRLQKQQDGTVQGYRSPVVIQDLMREVEEMRLNVFWYLRHVTAYDLDGQKKWMLPEMVDYLVAEGDVTTATKDLRATNLFGAAIRVEESQRLDGERFYNGDLVGIYNFLTYKRVTCPAPVYSTNVEDCLVDWDRPQI